MGKSFYVHGNNIIQKMAKPNYPKILDEVYEHYLHWREASESLNSENDSHLKQKVALLNEYKNLDSCILAFSAKM